MFVEIFINHPFISALLAVIALKWLFTKKCQLPGPTGLPLLGYMPFLGRFPYQTMTKLGKTYGDIYQLSVGHRTLVILNSAAVVQEAYGKDLAFAGRPHIPSLQTFAESGKSRFAFKDGDHRWRFLRKSATKALSLFATSRNSKLEEVVKEGLERFYAEIDSKLDVAFDPHRAIFELISGIVGSIMFGFDFDPKNKILGQVLGIQTKLSQFLQVGSLMDNIPLGRYIFHFSRMKFLRNIQGLMNVTESYIQEHTYNGPDDAVRDISDALTKTAAETPQSEIDELGIDDLQIRYISQDLFAAGFATTMDSLIWLVNLTAGYPEVQEKVHQELDRELAGREPTLNDRINLNYVEAVLYEAFRVASLLPFGIPHSTQADTSFRGMFIPEGCTVFANLYGIHRDEKLFPDPEKFNPDRFIKQNGQVDVDLGAKVYPFSTGKRRCIGENLARQELALIYASVLQRYQFSMAEGQKVDLTQSSVGFTRSPVRYQMVFTRREF